MIAASILRIASSRLLSSATQRLHNIHVIFIMRIMLLLVYNVCFQDGALRLNLYTLMCLYVPFLFVLWLE